MKLFSKKIATGLIALSICLPMFLRPVFGHHQVAVFIVQQEKDCGLATFTKQELMNKWSIPKLFIEIQTVEKCSRERSSHAFFQICIRKNGEHLRVYADSEKLSQFKVFGLLENAGTDIAQGAKND